MDDLVQLFVNERLQSGVHKHQPTTFGKAVRKGEIQTVHGIKLFYELEIVGATLPFGCRGNPLAAVRDSFSRAFGLLKRSPLSA
jgi:hypothetical protein